MNPKEIFELLKKEIGDGVSELVEKEHHDPFIVVSADSIVETCLVLRDDLNTLFDYLVNLSGVDDKDKFVVVYHLYSLKYKHRIVLKVYLDRENPHIPTVERVWRSANWHEREAYDMFGIVFDGHSDLRRILCPYDWEGHPLRKDYKTPDYYKDIKVPL
ncbi:MAG: NADH-quinone oxidoreductase subunit C [Ignavibacteria bacterium]|nr:NADH-quinone oxidoreductase subunit C [Ignavibacteria bacterium]